MKKVIKIDPIYASPFYKDSYLNDAILSVRASLTFRQHILDLIKGYNYVKIFQDKKDLSKKDSFYESFFCEFVKSPQENAFHIGSNKTIVLHSFLHNNGYKTWMLKEPIAYEFERLNETTFQAKRIAYKKYKLKPTILNHPTISEK